MQTVETGRQRTGERPLYGALNDWVYAGKYMGPMGLISQSTIKLACYAACGWPGKSVDDMAD